MRWPAVVFGRKQSGDVVEKTITVRGNPLANLDLRPWLEEGTVLSAPPGYATEDQGRNRIGYTFKTTSEHSVTIDILK